MIPKSHLVRMISWLEVDNHLHCVSSWEKGFQSQKIMRAIAKADTSSFACVCRHISTNGRKKEKGKNIAQMGGWNSIQNWSDMKTVQVIIINF